MTSRSQVPGQHYAITFSSQFQRQITITLLLDNLIFLFVCVCVCVRVCVLSGVVINALAFRPTGRSEVRILAMPLFYLGQVVYTHIGSPSQLQETGVQKGVFGLDRCNG